jgi:small subunit ribosomal protein S15
MKLALPMGVARKTDTRENKAKIVKSFGKSTTDTGSTTVQIALITNKINELAPHFQQHSKDHSARRGLLKLVGQRRRLLNYLKGKDEKAYVETITKLELRK